MIDINVCSNTMRLDYTITTLTVLIVLNSQSYISNVSFLRSACHYVVYIVKYLSGVAIDST